MEEVSFFTGSGFKDLYDLDASDNIAEDTSSDTDLSVTEPEDSFYEGESDWKYGHDIDSEESDIDITVPWTSNAAITKDFDFNYNNLSDRTLLFDSQLWAESNYGDPRYLNSSAGAQGPGQFVPETWNWAQEMGWVQQGADPYDMDSSISAQSKFMEWLYQRPIVQSTESEEDRIRRTLAGYNWGVGNLSKYIKKHGDEWFTQLPETHETKEYINKIMSRTKKAKESGYESDYSWYD